MYNVKLKMQNGFLEMRRECFNDLSVRTMAHGMTCAAFVSESNDSLNDPMTNDFFQ